jgi:hypothetical protein
VDARAAGNGCGNGGCNLGSISGLRRDAGTRSAVARILTDGNRDRLVDVPVVVASVRGLCRGVLVNLRGRAVFVKCDAHTRPADNTAYSQAVLAAPRPPGLGSNDSTSSDRANALTSTPHTRPAHASRRASGHCLGPAPRRVPPQGKKNL